MNVLDARSGQYIFGQDPGGTYNGWVLLDDATRQMVRDAGWSEYLANGTLDRVYVGMVALASGFPTGAQFYWQRTSTGAATDFTFDDAPNEAILIFDDGTVDPAEDDFFRLFCREPDYLYDDASLTDVGESGTGAYKVSLPISVGSDLDIKATDAVVALAGSVSTATWAGGEITYNLAAAHGLVIGDFAVVTGASPAGYNQRGVITWVDTDSFKLSASDPGAYTSGGTVNSAYSLINVKYFTSAFSRDIDTATNREFGIVIDAGTHSGIDGSAPGGASVLTSAAGGLTVDAWIGGTLTIYEGTDEGVSFPITDNDATTVTVTGTVASGSGLSFTLAPAVSPNASLQQIYTKIQYLLRQNSNINNVSGTVNGKTASLLLNFVGSSLKCGFYIPTNPNAGGEGVLVQGVRAADINSIVFYDNTGITGDREYPYASAGTLNFSANLVTGGAGYFRMYFTNDDAGDNAGYDYGTADAITVDDADDADITGTITGASIPFDYDFTGNIQRGAASAGQNAPVTVIAGNPGYAKPVVATGTITESKSIVVMLTAETDRAYLE
jgi:hypothetical protein